MRGRGTGQLVLGPCPCLQVVNEPRRFIIRVTEESMDVITRNAGEGGRSPGCCGHVGPTGYQAMVFGRGPEALIIWTLPESSGISVVKGLYYWKCLL